MNYKIESADSSKIKLVQTGGMTLFGLIFLIIGLPVALIGGIILVSASSETMGYFMSGFGLIFASAGMLVLMTRKNYPRAFIFDNDLGALLLEDQISATSKPMALPYHEINGFEINIYVSTSSNSSGGTSRSVQYAVDVKKKDGALWTLFQSNFRKRSEAYRDQLLSMVHLTNEFKGTTDASSERIDYEEIEGAAGLKWKQKLSFFKLLLFVMVLGGFNAIFYGVSLQTSGLFIFPLLIGFFLLLILVLIVNYLSGLGKEHMIGVNQEYLTYRRPGLLFKYKESKIAISTIYSISFNLTAKDYAYIRILSKEDTEMFEKMRGGDVGLGDIASSFRATFKSPKISVDDLSFSDRFYLESKLQEAIKKISGHDVL